MSSRSSSRPPRSKSGSAQKRSRSRSSSNRLRRIGRSKEAEDLKREQTELTRSLLILGLLFLLSVLGMYGLISSFPPLSEFHSASLHTRFALRSSFWDFLPTKLSGEDLEAIHGALNFYLDDYPLSLSLLFCSSYIFLQTFAIPGPIVLSVLSGALFGGVQGLILTSGCATLGASMCYWIFRFCTVAWVMSSLILAVEECLVSTYPSLPWVSLFSRPIVLTYFATPLAKMKKKLDQNKNNLFWYMLFLRITPLVPNWFLNLSSGNLAMPFQTFFLATLLGLIPNNIIMVRTGIELAKIESLGALDFGSIAILLVLGSLALIPTFFKNKLEKVVSKGKLSGKKKKK